LLNNSSIDNQKFYLAAILEVHPEKQPDYHVLNELFSNGLDLLYLRTSSSEEIAWNKILDNFHPEYRHRLIVPVSSREVFQETELIWHWKEAEREKLQPEIVPPANVYSTSVHHLSGIIDLPAAFRYVFYSPVFESISKPGYRPQHDLKTVKHTLENVQQIKGELPIIIGLGGITATNVKLVKELGFNGAALMGALWQASDSVQAFKEIKIALNS
jgi:thiamine-phosphate pyrophosphorylase